MSTEAPFISEQFSYLRSSAGGSMGFFLVLFFSFACLQGTCTVASAHGVYGDIDRAQGIMAHAAYDDGEPMSYAKVEIFKKGENLPFQTGMTDRNGRFLFLPDRQGDWKVVISDEMGHKIALKAVVDDMARMSVKGAGGSPTVTRWQGMVAGLGIISGFFSILFWYYSIHRRQGKT